MLVVAFFCVTFAGACAALASTSVVSPWARVAGWVGFAVFFLGAVVFFFLSLALDDDRGDW